MLGVRLALQPGAGRTAVPVRSTVASAVVGVAALTGALVFSASLGNLLATPRLYGVTWDAYVSSTEGAGSGGPQADRPSRGHRVVARRLGCPAVRPGHPADAIAMLPGHHGDLLPVPVRGHLPIAWPDHAREKTLAAAHARVGADRRRVAGRGPPGTVQDRRHGRLPDPQ